MVLGLLLATVALVATGCYDPYYGRGRVHTGVYASYGTAPYYGYRDPYGYGYGYHRGYVTPRYRTGVASIRVGSAAHRGYYGTRPRYRHRGYPKVRRGGSGHVRRSGYVRRGRGEARQRRGQARRGGVQRTRVRAEVQPY